jgi:hypothetical protein
MLIWETTAGIKSKLIELDLRATQFLVCVGLIWIWRQKTAVEIVRLYSECLMGRDICNSCKIQCEDKKVAHHLKGRIHFSKSIYELGS